jgi:threonine/homoserine/homoserine lactone efflux protein
MHFFNGLLIGMSMVIFVGPVFFLLLTSSLSGGWKAGLAVALGIIISDLICVSLVSIGLAPLLSSPERLKWLGIGSGAMLIFLGIKYLINKKITLPNSEEKKSKFITHYFSKGFLINFINPFVWLVWLGIIKYAESKTNQHSSIYLAGVLIGIFATDVAKVFVANWINRWLDITKLHKIYKVIGVVLIGFGIKMLFDFLK